MRKYHKKISKGNLPAAANSSGWSRKHCCVLDIENESDFRLDSKVFRNTTLYPSVILTFVHRMHKSILRTTNYRTRYVQHVSFLRQVQILGTNVTCRYVSMRFRVHSKKSRLAFGRYQSKTSDKLLATVIYFCVDFLIIIKRMTEQYLQIVQNHFLPIS